MIHATATAYGEYYTEVMSRYIKSLKKAVKKSGFETSTRFDYYDKNLFAHPLTGEAIKMKSFAIHHEQENGELVKVKGAIFGYDQEGNHYELTAVDFNTTDNGTILNSLDRDVKREAKEAQQGDPIDRDEWLADQYEREAVDRERWG